jgi:hypothetical protein
MNTISFHSDANWIFERPHADSRVAAAKDEACTLFGATTTPRAYQDHANS